MFTYQRCTRCVMDNASDPTITFDAEGRCNYCTDVLRRMPTEYFPNEEGKRRLDAMVAEIKETCKNDPYDCIVGVSGGIDSSYILYWGWTQGLRMLAVHIDDGLDNPIATENLRKLVEKTGVTNGDHSAGYGGIPGCSAVLAEGKSAKPRNCTG